MALHVTLVKDPLKKDGSVRPRVVQADRVTIDELLSYMATDTALEVADMRAALERLKAGMLFYLSSGARVETPFGVFRLSARGTYGDGTAPRIETKNLGINYVPNSGVLYDLREKTQIVMEEATGVRRPVIQLIENADDRTLENEAKPGHVIQIYGTRLTFEIDDPELGVFFVAADHTETRATIYSRAGSNHIDCKVPDLAAAPYAVEVRPRSTAGSILTGNSAELLTVTV